MKKKPNIQTLNYIMFKNYHYVKKSSFFFKVKDAVNIYTLTSSFHTRCKFLHTSKIFPYLNFFSPTLIFFFHIKVRNKFLFTFIIWCYNSKLIITNIKGKLITADFCLNMTHKQRGRRFPPAPVYRSDRVY